MKLVQESSRIIKPLYQGTPPSTTDYIPLNVFDNVTYEVNNAIIYVYHPPNPSNEVIEMGLRKALSVFREWAGRLSKDGDGEPVILLNDAGVRFIEASVDIKIDQVMPLKPTAFYRQFHPRTEGVEELLQVQITRFTCGSILVGFTGHHYVADGQSASHFMVGWSQASRGLDIHPLPLRRDGFVFKPRDPPLIEYEHRGKEFNSLNLEKEDANIIERIVVDKVHFSLAFLAKLKSRASSNNGNGNKPYSTLESLGAHLWRAVTKARGLSLHQTTHFRLAVNGRMRMNPRIPNEFFGNLVLWAFPAAKVQDLLEEPLSYGAKLIHDAIADVDDKYFRSFIDFANSKVKEENLVPTAYMNPHIVEYPNLDVTSWLRFPFEELDFGAGCPCAFMPSYPPAEGSIFLLSSFIGDGSIDAIITLFEDHMASFKQVCYELDS